MSYIQLFRDHTKSGCEDSDTVDAVLDIMGLMT